MQYQQTLARLFIANGSFDETQARIQAIRSLGRWGQYALAADTLQASLDDARAQQSTTRRRP